MRYYSIKPESIGLIGVWKRQLDQCKINIFQIKSEFLRPYCIAYLDQILLQQSKNKKLSVISTYQNANQYLKQCQFEHLHKDALCKGQFPQRDIIPIRRFIGTPINIFQDMVGWAKDEVFKHLPELAPSLSKNILKNLWEIIDNGITHGEGEFGVTSCGQFYPQKGYFEIAFYDSGIGLVNKIKNSQKLPITTTHRDLMDWALQSGNSTKPVDDPGGLGLHLLREFVKINGGVFQIVSEDTCFMINNSQSEYHTIRNNIDGTLVNMRVIFDNKLYLLTGEQYE